jgi:hypothetical protein
MCGEFVQNGEEGVRPRPALLTRARRGCIITMAVGIAQLVEHRTVAPTVAGSIPVSHPRIFRWLSFVSACIRLGATVAAYAPCALAFGLGGTFSE